ncbi:MAG: 5'-deoxynucleotidase [Oscillospiraceae bacterium]|nr:MAG: 5'-deoxynucleotidase [Oscillospiraceae bacterium]
MGGFFAMISRMKYIDRWGLMRCTRNETLAEHTLETALLAHALVEIGNTRLDRGLDPGKAVLYALYHDTPEILTGDLPTPVKYHDRSIREAYRAIERQAGERLLAMLPASMQNSYAPYLQENAAGSYAPYVKAADKLSALIKCVEEQKAGNREFDEAAASIRKHPALSLPEAQIFLQEYFPAYQLPLDEVERYRIHAKEDAG